VVKIEVQETGSAAKASIGSGFFVSPDGHLVTNYHVISEVVQHPDRYRAGLTLGDQEEVTPVEVLNVDVAHDLAIVKVELVRESRFSLERSMRRRESVSTLWATLSTSVSISSRAPTTAFSSTPSTSASISPARSTPE
jgi:S1-C subfamily serine protease